VSLLLNSPILALSAWIDLADDGIGVANSENRFAKAAGSYQSAADTQASAVAFWNLGWMYENGLGVVQVSLIQGSICYCLQTRSTTDIA
jgi:TPR repeat protein